MNTFSHCHWLDFGIADATVIYTPLEEFADSFPYFSEPSYGNHQRRLFRQQITHSSHSATWSLAQPGTAQVQHRHVGWPSKG